MRKSSKDYKKENAAFREVLEWYADEIMTYSITQQQEPRSAVHEDGGSRAREVLGKFSLSE